MVNHYYSRACDVDTKGVLGNGISRIIKGTVDDFLGMLSVSIIRHIGSMVPYGAAFGLLGVVR